jgi:hypothetical protein
MNPGDIITDILKEKFSFIKSEVFDLVPSSGLPGSNYRDHIRQITYPQVMHDIFQCA